MSPAMLSSGVRWRDCCQEAALAPAPHAHRKPLAKKMGTEHANLIAHTYVHISPPPNHSRMCCSSRALSFMPKLFSFLNPLAMINSALYQKQQGICNIVSASVAFSLLHPQWCLFLSSAKSSTPFYFVAVPHRNPGPGGSDSLPPRCRKYPQGLVFDTPSLALDLLHTGRHHNGHASLDQHRPSYGCFSIVWKRPNFCIEPMYSGVPFRHTGMRLGGTGSGQVNVLLKGAHGMPSHQNCASNVLRVGIGSCCPAVHRDAGC